MSEQTAGLTYKGRPLMRKDNMIYYGSCLLYTSDAADD